MKTGADPVPGRRPSETRETGRRQRRQSCSQKGATDTGPDRNPPLERHLPSGSPGGNAILSEDQSSSCLGPRNVSGTSRGIWAPAWSFPST